MTDNRQRSATSGRMGGRAARQALRAAPIPEDERAVQPGQASGRYQPLTESEVLRIHQAALEALEQIGIANAIPSCQELVTEAGGSITEEGRLLFPRSLVEDIVASAARDIVLPGQDPRYDMHLTGNRTYFGTAGACLLYTSPSPRD